MKQYDRALPWAIMRDPNRLTADQWRELVAMILEEYDAEEEPRDYTFWGKYAPCEWGAN